MTHSSRTLRQLCGLNAKEHNHKKSVRAGQSEPSSSPPVSSSPTSREIYAKWGSQLNSLSVYKLPPTEGAEFDSFIQYIDDQAPRSLYGAHTTRAQSIADWSRNSKVYESFRKEVCDGKAWTEELWSEYQKSRAEEDTTAETTITEDSHRSPREPSEE